MITTYVIVALWNAFLFGAGTHELITRSEESTITQYNIGVGYHGETLYSCPEKSDIP